MASRVLLSHTITQTTPAYANKDRVVIRDSSSILKGDTANTSCWIITNNHMGTHIDTPRHFAADGKKTDEYDLDTWFFSKVGFIELPCTEAKLIGINDLKDFQLEADIELLIIRTGYEQYRQEDKYWAEGPGLAAELADYFREKYPSLRCVGFDFISLTSFKFRPEGRVSHRAFLTPGEGKQDILVIEDMKLSPISGKMAEVVVAPLFVEDGNGGAVTVFATIDV